MFGGNPEPETVKAPPGLPQSLDKLIVGGAWAPTTCADNPVMSHRQRTVARARRRRTMWAILVSAQERLLAEPKLGTYLLP